MVSRKAEDDWIGAIQRGFFPEFLGLVNTHQRSMEAAGNSHPLLHSGLLSF